MKVDDLKCLAEDMGIETKGLKKAQLIEAIAGEEITVDEEDGDSAGASEDDGGSEGEADYGEED